MDIWGVGLGRNVDTGDLVINLAAGERRGETNSSQFFSPTSWNKKWRHCLFAIFSSLLCLLFICKREHYAFCTFLDANLIFVTTIITAGCVKNECKKCKKFQLERKKTAFHTVCLKFHITNTHNVKFYKQFCLETPFAAKLRSFEGKISWPQISVV